MPWKLDKQGVFQWVPHTGVNTSLTGLAEELDRRAYQALDNLCLSDNFKLNFQVNTSQDPETLAPLNPGSPTNLGAAVPKGFSKSVSDEEYLRIRAKVQQETAKYGIDWRLFMCLIQAESDFANLPQNSAGAAGLVQLLSVTAREMGISPSERYDFDKAIEAGVRYLGMMFKQFKSKDLALAAYNAGPGNVKKYNGIPPFQETQNYVRKINDYYSDSRRQY